jgi:hypothetical protein
VSEPAYCAAIAIGGFGGWLVFAASTGSNSTGRTSKSPIPSRFFIGSTPVFVPRIRVHGWSVCSPAMNDGMRRMAARKWNRAIARAAQAPQAKNSN